VPFRSANVASPSGRAGKFHARVGHVRNEVFLNVAGLSKKELLLDAAVKRHAARETGKKLGGVCWTESDFDVCRDVCIHSHAFVAPFFLCALMRIRAAVSTIYASRQERSLVGGFRCIDRGV
jgi:hypothetical protein